MPHDVHALALAAVPGTKTPLLVSGGADSQLCCQHLDSKFGIGRARKLAPFPQQQHLGAHLSAERRLLLVPRSATELELWQLPPATAAAGAGEGERVTPEVKHSKAARLQLRSKMSCAALAPSGAWLAVSDAVERSADPMTTTHSLKPMA